MKSKIEKIWNWTSTVLVSLVVLFALALWGVRLVGMEVFVVQSGSMEPEYKVGSIVYVKDADVSKLEVGDVITFNLGGGTRGTHRIIEVLEQDGERAFRTKGDANDHPDNGLQTESNIVGQVVFTVPWMGYLISYIQQPPGMYIAVAVVALILLFTILPDIIFGSKKNKNTGG